MTKLAEQLKRGADQAWESLSEGWRGLSARAGSALTRFRPTSTRDTRAGPDEGWPPIGGWAFMAADVFLDDDKVVVRIEAPGMRREDFHVDLHGDHVTVRGEKRFDKEVTRGRYSIVQCAYGSFHRDVALPVPVKPDKSKASYRDGVLRIELPKADEARARHIAVKTA